MWPDNWETPTRPRGDVTADLERERDLSIARFLLDDVLGSEDVVADIRNRVEREALTFMFLDGSAWTIDDYVRSAFGHLAILLRERSNAQS